MIWRIYSAHESVVGDEEVVIRGKLYNLQISKFLTTE